GTGPARLQASFVSTLLLLIADGVAPDVSAPYRFNHWTTDDGLPQNSVMAILQTHDGYLWLATSDGVVRYDGVRFQVFDRRSTKGGIASNRFSARLADRQGTLWLRTAERCLPQYQAGAPLSYPTKA